MLKKDPEMIKEGFGLEIENQNFFKWTKPKFDSAKVLAHQN